MKSTIIKLSCYHVEEVVKLKHQLNNDITLCFYGDRGGKAKYEIHITFSSYFGKWIATLFLKHFNRQIKSAETKKDNFLNFDESDS